MNPTMAVPQPQQIAEDQPRSQHWFDPNPLTYVTCFNLMFPNAPQPISDDWTGFTIEQQAEFRSRLKHYQVDVDSIHGIEIPADAPLLWKPAMRAKQCSPYYEPSKDPVLQLNYCAPEAWAWIMTDMWDGILPRFPPGWKEMSRDQRLHYTAYMRDMAEAGWTPVERRSMMLFMRGMDPDIAAAEELGRRLAQEEISRRKAEGITSGNDANPSSLHDQEISAQDSIDPALLAWDGRGKGKGCAEAGTSVANPFSPHNELPSMADETLDEWNADRGRVCEARDSKASI
jgi:hypothetical protein